MTQYNTLNVKLSNLQLSNLKSGIEKSIELTLNLSSNVTGDSTDETNFPYKVLLTVNKFQGCVKVLWIIN